MTETPQGARVLIADDEPLARERLRSLLASEPGMEVVGECADGVSAIAAIQTLKPDLVFLDVEMPGSSGFDVIEAVGPSRMPCVIFVTAYDKYVVFLKSGTRLTLSRGYREKLQDRIGRSL